MNLSKKQLILRCIYLFLLFFCTPWIGSLFAGTVTAELNQLEITFDEETGSILRLYYPGPGTMLETSVDRASILDLAYPIEEFLPLRLASRFAKNAKITISDNEVSVSWDRLGLSRNQFNINPHVSAKVWFKANPDGESISLFCHIENNSDRSIQQVLFPDLKGWIPFAGTANTQFRAAGVIDRPFQTLKFSDQGQFYVNRSMRPYHSTRGNMMLRWMDLGGLNGGVSIFPRIWQTEERTDILVNLSPTDNTLRLMFPHDIEIKPGTEWTSEEYVLTPHTHGWAKGAQTARNFFLSNVKRDFAVPEHVQKGLGYRTVWMTQNLPEDPKDAAWQISQLPDIARESKTHGLDEMVFWCMFPTKVPIPPDPYPHIGTREELEKAMRACKQIGVNPCLFLTSLLAEHGTDSEKYILRDPDRKPENWTYHPEMIPQFRSAYSSAKTWVRVDPADPNWQQDVLKAAEDKAKIGLTSFCWDVYQQDMGPINKKMRTMAKQYDPNSTYAGEQQQNLEFDCEQLDYTWNWNDRTYRDFRPLIYLLPVMRHNLIVGGDSIEQTVLGFADNLYLNVMPRNPGEINGAAEIEDYPQFSRTLKKCAKLRDQFLQYFTDGVLIGDCILTEPVPHAHVNAYVLPDSALIIAINTDRKEKTIQLQCDLSPWLKKTADCYSLTMYRDNGNEQETKMMETSSFGIETDSLDYLQMNLIEIRADHK